MDQESFQRGFIKAALANGLNILEAAELLKQADSLLKGSLGGGLIGGGLGGVAGGGLGYLAGRTLQNQ